MVVEPNFKKGWYLRLGFVLVNQIRIVNFFELQLGLLIDHIQF